MTRSRTICKGCLHGIEHHPDKGACTYGRTTLFGGCRCPAYGTPKSKIPTGPIDPDELEIDKARASLQAELDRFCATMKTILQRRRQAAFERDVLPADIAALEARARSPVMEHVVRSDEILCMACDTNREDLHRHSFECPRSQRPARKPQGVHSTGTVSKLGRTFLLVLAQHRAGCTRKQVLLFAGYRSSGDTSTAFAELLKSGYAQAFSDILQITDAGLRELGPFTPLPTGAALRRQILEKANPFTQAALEELFAAYPQSMTRAEILEATGYKSSGDTSTAFARMVLLGYARKVGRGLMAAAELFP